MIYSSSLMHIMINHIQIVFRSVYNSCNA